MYALLKKLFLFLFPIVRTAVVQVAADELNKVAYPKNPRRTRFERNRDGTYSVRRHTPYSRMAPRTQREAVRNVGRAMRYVDDLKPSEPFHDILMVAFDISGPSRTMVEEWLYENLPRAENWDDKVSVDSYWIADDDCEGSDNDSAVFVSKGNQEAARGLLRKHGLVE